MGRPPGAKNIASCGGGTKNGVTKQAISGKTAAATTAKSSGRNGALSKANSELAPPQSSGKGVGKGGSSGTATSSALGGTTEKDKNTQDRSQANFPYDIRLGGFASLQNAALKGTPRIKRLLMDECDFIMECRVCRNLFRSLPNFITHKSNYCKKSFDSTWCIGLSNIIANGDSSFNVQYEVDPELVLIQSKAAPSASQSPACESPKTVTVAEMYNELANASKALNEKQTSQPVEENVVRLKLQPLKLPGDEGICKTISGGGIESVIVQQKVICNDPSACDNVPRPREFSKNDTAILGPDGKVLCTAPGDKVELVVKKLAAQIESVKKREAQKLAELERNRIICDVCRTVFDSDKALRQHKRESLDCGKVWGFKSPLNDKSKIMIADTEIVVKRMKYDNSLNCDDDTTSRRLDVESSTQTTKKPNRRFGPRRQSNTINGVTPADKKRTLSPVKRIKLKYIKYDQSKHHEADGEKVPHCTKCRVSFVTEQDLLKHLVLCTNPSNNQTEKEETKPEERIRISLRNDFSAFKAICPPNVSVNLEPSVSTNPTNSILSESHRQLTTLRLQHLAGPLTGIDPTPSCEVNNNKQYKSYPLSGRKSSSSSDEGVSTEKTSKEAPSVSNRPEEEGDSDITSHDSGISSLSSSWKKSRSVGAPKKPKLKLNKTSAPANNELSKSDGDSSRMNVGTSVSELDTAITEKVNTSGKRKDKVSKNLQRIQSSVNLRKTITSRIRKSRRTKASSAIKVTKTCISTKAMS